ncbi:MAG: nitroreductase family protein [Bacillota bacterium]
MEFNEVITKRRSIRKFTNEPIPDSLIRELMDAGRLAPSGLNIQPWRYVVVKSEEMRNNISHAIFSPHAAGSPVLILCCADLMAFSAIPARIKELKEAGAFAGTYRENSDFNDVLENKNTNNDLLKINAALNTAISIDHILLKATDLGLGSCWLGAFDESKIKESASLDDRYNVIAVLAIGYPDQSPSPRPRLSVDELLIKEL